MKVLFDTCVWSLSLRRSPKSVSKTPDETSLLKALTEAITYGRVAMIGRIEGEFFDGRFDYVTEVPA